ncbi:Tad domain-containing protein [Pectinatus sottacetonis]|uniref:Tad domain-containing protein n=1 Tax=Pectinatus sottacetonis TaxID=1002795 RepID=UPI0018C67B99|nr:Tad domain-containing protein [Pectinatus sottacetonis]
MKHFINWQKGAVLVFFALILPALIAFTGLAVDFGNVYVHKSQLQNMTDASVLAAAQEYSHTQDSNDAQNTALEYINDNKHLNHGSGFNNPVPATSSYPVITVNNGITKLKLTLNDTVPMYFLRLFGYNQMDISATANAQVVNPLAAFADLIRFSQILHITQGHQNNQYKTTFDGTIGYVSPADGYNSIETSNNNNNPPDQIQNAIYSSSGEQITPYQRDNMPDFSNTPFSLSALKKSADNINPSFGSNKVISSDKLTGKIIYIDQESPDIVIDKPLPGSNDPEKKNIPLILVYDNPGVLNIHVNSDTGRPLIIYYTGTGEIHYNPGPGVPTFTGIIYAPKTKILTNENKAAFSGSIYCQSYYSQVEGSYTYKSFDSPFSQVILTDD